MTLILVYNAEQGLFNTLTDAIHKAMAPHTYACRLCYFMHGTFGMLRPWKLFLESLGVPLAFYYRKEFVQSYDCADIPLPALLLEREGDLQTLVSADEINACRDLQALTDKVSAAFAARASS
ncbi:MAG: hypothetical protein AB7N70_16495 [Dehalococcoidia bacterium]